MVPPIYVFPYSTYLIHFICCPALKLLNIMVMGTRRQENTIPCTTLNILAEKQDLQIVIVNPKRDTRWMVVIRPTGTEENEEKPETRQKSE